MSVGESLDKTHYFTVANAFFPLVFPGNHSNPCGIFVIPAENSWKKSPVLPHRNNATLLQRNKVFYPSPGFCLVVTIFKVNKQIRLRRHDKIHFVPLVDFFCHRFLSNYTENDKSDKTIQNMDDFCQFCSFCQNVYQHNMNFCK